MKAREVLRDCEYTRKRLQDAIEKNNLNDAKVFWFSSLAMLRSIGHVLHNVDAKEQGGYFGDILEENFKRWKKDPVFANFIEKERNNILKEYASSLSEQKNLEEFCLVTESGERLVTESEDAIVGTTTVTTLIKGDGMYSGISPVDALDKALRWWEKNLSEFEQQLLKKNDT